MAAEDQDAQNWERINKPENAWHDRETLAEFKRLMDADCLYLTVITGRDRSKDRDATHHLPRLLELAERGLSPPAEHEAIAIAIRGRPVGDEASWEHLDDARKQPWLEDADRVLEVLRVTRSTPAASAEDAG